VRGGGQEAVPGGGRFRSARLPASAHAGAATLTYPWGMGKILLFLLGVFAVIMLISIVISALHFLFIVALIAVIVVGALRLTGGMRRRRGARW
jgi:hypothetical protein